MFDSASAAADPGRCLSTRRSAASASRSAARQHDPGPGANSLGTADTVSALTDGHHRRLLRHRQFDHPTAGYQRAISVYRSACQRRSTTSAAFLDPLQPPHRARASAARRGFRRRLLRDHQHRRGDGRRSPTTRSPGAQGLVPVPAGEQHGDEPFAACSDGDRTTAPGTHLRVRRTSLLGLSSAAGRPRRQACPAPSAGNPPPADPPPPGCFSRLSGRRAGIEFAPPAPFPQRPGGEPAVSTTDMVGVTGSTLYRPPRPRVAPPSRTPLRSRQGRFILRIIAFPRRLELEVAGAGASAVQRLGRAVACQSAPRSPRS